MKNLYKGLLLILSIAGLLSINGCSTIQQEVNPTQMRSQWLNQSGSFDQKTITGILVVAASDNPTTKRLYEDITSNTFALNGIPTQPAYKFINDGTSVVLQNGGLNLPVLRQAAKQAKVSDILILTFNGIKNQTVYNPGVTWGPDPFWGGPFGPGPFGPGPFWGPDPMWGGWAIPPSITTNQYLASNAQLLLAKDNQTLWTASFTTLMDQFSAEKTIELYAQLLVQKILANGFMVPLQAPNYQIQAPVLNPGVTAVAP